MCIPKRLVCVFLEYKLAYLWLFKYQTRSAPKPLVYSILSDKNPSVFAWALENPFRRQQEINTMHAPAVFETHI